MDLTLIDYLQNDNFVFHERVPTLREIASFNVALELCTGIVHRKTFQNEEFELDRLLRYDYESISEEAEQMLQQWNIPLTIKDFINECCSSVAKKLCNWTYHINSELFHANFLCRFHFECLVWQSNGKIHFEKSARKMLSHPGISQTDKFIIMCDFCWKDEIEGLVPGVDLQQFINDIMDDSEEFYEFPLAYYWICKLSNELHMIPVEDALDTIEFFMLSNYVDHLSAIEYFWNSVDKRDQIMIVIKFLDSPSMADKQISILAKLNEFQKRNVIAEIPHAIIANFIRSSNFEAASFLWNRVENLIGDDQFSTLLTNIMKKLFEEKHFFFLTELWDTANDHHKTHFVRYRRDFIVEFYFSRTFEGIRDGRLPFLFAILSYASSAYRRDIILEHGDVLFVGYRNYSAVNKIIGFCLPNSDEIVKFKELLNSSHEIKLYFHKCIYENGNFEIMVKYLESYVHYQSILKHHMRQVLDDTQKLRNNGIYFFETWSHVKKLLDIVYGADLLNVIKIKNKLIFSLDVDNHYYEYLPPSVEGLRQYKNAIQDLIDDKITLHEVSAME